MSGEGFEIPSLISLSLERIARSYPTGFDEMRSSISSATYANVVTALQELSLCPQCESWVTGYTSNGQCYHFAVHHRNLMSTQNCLCGYCQADPLVRYEARSVPCISCRRNFHYQHDGAGKYCDTRVRSEPNILESGVYSNTWRSKFVPTTRTPTSILKWCQDSRGYSLCDFCLRDMLGLGQLRKQYLTLESLYVPSYCDGCGLSINSRDPWYPARNIQSIVRIGDDEVYIDRSETCPDCMFVSRHFRLDHDTPGNLINNLVDGSLLCNICFLNIKDYLHEVSRKHHRPL